MNEANEFLQNASGTSYPAVKFDSVGDTFIGDIFETPMVVERPALNPPHDLEKQLVINLTAPDGTERTLWVRKGFLAQAISEAVATTGAAGLEVGGKLAVKRDADRDTGKIKPAYTYKVKYTPPVASTTTAVDDSMFEN